MKFGERQVGELHDGPSGTTIGCCVCLNETGERGGATHIVNEAGRSYGVCDTHLDAELPPRVKAPTRKAT